MEKLEKYQQLAFEIRERRPGYKVIVIPIVIGCLGGGMRRAIHVYIFIYLLKKKKKKKKKKKCYLSKTISNFFYMV